MIPPAVVVQDIQLPKHVVSIKIIGDKFAVTSIDGKIITHLSWRPIDQLPIRYRGNK